MGKSLLALRFLTGGKGLAAGRCVRGEGSQLGRGCLGWEATAFSFSIVYSSRHQNPPAIADREGVVSSTAFTPFPAPFRAPAILGGGGGGPC